MHIQAYGSYCERIDTTQELPNLRPALAELGIPRFRRIDRFTELCLLGAGLCAQHHAVESAARLSLDTGIILCSQMAGISSTVQAHQQIFRQRQAPKPANFINTLSNSAGFYVAKHLQITGENHFLTRSGGAFEAGLTLLKQCQVDHLLLGYVEECSMPLPQHRRRLGLASNARISEHSHWFLITRQALPGTLASVTDLQRVKSSHSLAAMFESHKRAMMRYVTPRAQLSAPTLSSDIDAENTSQALAMFLQQHHCESLRCVSQDDSGFYYLMEFSR